VPHDEEKRADEAFPWVRSSNVVGVVALTCALLALARFHTFHNETFDLAFYTRILWGLSRGDLYHPLTDSHVFGLHASWVLFPLAWLGRLIPLIPLMLVVQSVALAGAAIPLARMAARRLRTPFAADVTVLSFLLYPTVLTAATYEFHPSSLALLPLAYTLDAWDRTQWRKGAVALFVAAMCREDVALVASVMGLVLAASKDREQRRWGLAIAALATAYFCGYQFAFAPKYLPQRGSLSLHFGALGSTPTAIAKSVLLHPIATVHAVASPAKWLYLPRLLAPVAFLSLLAPRWLVPALVPVGINFLSQWPTATQVRSHYALLAVPFVFASAIHGAARLVDARHALGAPIERPTGRRMLTLCAAIVLGAGLIAQRRSGATPISRLFRARDFQRDARANELERIIRAIRPGVIVVAPDYALAHIAQRPSFQRLEAWTRQTDELIVSIEHRLRYDGTQTLWRTREEITVRNVLTRGKYGIVRAERTHLLLRRGVSPRSFAEGRYIAFDSDAWSEPKHVDVDASIAIASWRIEAWDARTSNVTLWLVTRQRWPHDLGLELGWGPMHRNGDRDDPERIHSFLPYDGLLSPVHVRVGEVSRMTVTLSATRHELLQHGLYFGARRIDGSRLHREAPHWVRLDVPTSR
jgi:uncharacterized membrane protein